MLMFFAVANQTISTTKYEDCQNTYTCILFSLLVLVTQPDTWKVHVQFQIPYICGSQYYYKDLGMYRVRTPRGYV